MRPADGDRIAEAHQLGEHFGAAHHRQQLFARCDEFRIALLDCRRNDDDLSLTQVFSPVADIDFDALVAEALHIGAV